MIKRCSAFILLSPISIHRLHTHQIPFNRYDTLHSLQTVIARCIAELMTRVPVVKKFRRLLRKPFALYSAPQRKAETKWLIESGADNFEVSLYKTQLSPKHYWRLQIDLRNRYPITSEGRLLYTVLNVSE